jgi:hypothetical protein
MTAAFSGCVNLIKKGIVDSKGDYIKITTLEKRDH